MADQSLSDEEIIALTRKRVRQRKIIIFLCAFLSGGIGAFSAIKIGELHRAHQPISILSLWPIESAGVLALAAFLAALYFTRTPRGAYSERLVQKRIDELQWQYTRWFLIMVPTGVLYLAVRAELQTIFLMDHGNFPPLALEIGLFLFLGAISLLMLSPFGVKRSLRKVMNDELIRTVRARALSLGFWVSVPCMAAIYVLSLINQKLAIECMVPALFLAVAVPTLRFAYLDWRASRSN
jgi:hypothetical protein